MRSATLALLFCVAWITPALGQTSAPAFEVASIHQNTSGESRWFPTPPALASHGEVSIVNMPLRAVIAQAYEINASNERFMLVGGPDNILSKQFDIRAKPAADGTRAQALVMLRTLLADRFKLRIHTENRPTAVYALTVLHAGKLGPDMRPATDDCAAFRKARQADPSAEEPRDAYGHGACMLPYDFKPGLITVRDVSSVDGIVTRLQGFTERPIMNATRLTGSFNWVVTFALNSTDLDASPIYQAVQDRLGLKLESRTEPREVFVIESVQMPTPD